MKYVQEVEDHASLRALVLQDLKDLGIKPPKSKKNKGNDSLDYGQPGVFGTHLNLVPSVIIDYCGPVPKFLVAACHLLEKHISTEGLFRKSGAVSRQKELKQKAENGEEFNDAHPFDVAGLVKQFFRELPDPLLTSRLHDTFLKCHQLEPEHARVSAILLLCHLLPWPHLSTLRFTMIFLRKIADKAEVNKMDVPNLAVCLAPNLLHTNTRNDKMKETESKLLQMQTSIVQYLITNADSIGMVSDSLYERTTLMLSCFHSEDELEKSDGQIFNDSNTGKKKKGKKKRSGSFQGLVSNLSNSFSKWRRDSKGHNQSNISDKSTLSVMSMVDKSSVMPNDGGYTYEYENNPLCPDATPKLMRKRKAEDEAVPFSASKKKTIMESLPHHSALGHTPFKTPSTMRKADRSDMVFTGQTPSRNDASKSSCFTPKTPKSNMKRKVKGLWRRLSGSKDPQQSPSSQGLNCSDFGSSFSSNIMSDYVDPPEGSQKKALVRRHRKTPSSPARLVSNLLGEDGENQRHGITPDSSSSSLVSGTSSNPSIASLELMARLHGDMRSGVRSPATSSEISLEDKAKYTKDDGNVSLGNKSGLRRGRPNTLRSGLPSPAKRRSLDTTNTSDKEQRNNTIFSTVDTSPIQMVEPMHHTDEHSPVLQCQLDYGSDDTDDESSSSEESDEDEEEQDVHEANMHRQLSVTSIMSVAESDHDRAFIHESMLADMTNIADDPESDSKNCDGALEVVSGALTTNDNTSGASADINRNETEGGFKKPFGVPISSCGKHIVRNNLIVSDVSQNISIEQMSGTAATVTTSSTVSTLGQSKSDSQLKQGKSVESIDSGVYSEDGKLSKSASLQSIESPDSGMSVERSQSHPSQLEKSHISPLQRMPSIRKPNLQVSSDMKQMLSRAGVSTTEHSSERPTNDREDLKALSSRRDNPLRFSNSQSRKRGVSPIRIPTIFARADEEAQKYREIGRSVRGNSPMRKANLPIGTGLVNAESVINARTKLALDSPGECDNVASTSKQTTPTTDVTPPCAGHTPMYPLGSKNNLVVKDVDNIENEVSLSTPKIKPMLMTSDVTKRLLAVVPPNSTETSMRKISKSPIKPVKRLQCSPKSPKRKNSSPKNVKTLVKNGERLSPLPPHMANEDWDV